MKLVHKLVLRAKQIIAISKMRKFIVMQVRCVFSTLKGFMFLPQTHNHAVKIFKNMQPKSKTDDINKTFEAVHVLFGSQPSTSEQ